MAEDKRVLFWPTSKHLADDWHEDADQAAWLGTCRRVCEAYSPGLRGGGLAGRHSILQLRVDSSTDELASGGHVLGVVNVDRFAGPEFGRVHVPRGTARLTPEVRADFAPRTSGVRVRQGRDKVTGRINRPAPDAVDSGDPARLAYEDALALMTAVQRRFDLGPLPPLPVPCR